MNRTDSEYIYDDDAVSFGPTNNGWFLLASFAIVATYLSLCSEGLNVLEMFTVGTSYHLMLQRMYRELMMVGLASFVFTIMSQSNNSALMTHKFYNSFAFADVCCFVMAVFFCAQGVFIMLGSIGQARVWNVAANISSEELNLNVEESKHLLSWKQRYWPFSTTRDQVEFRILRSIFTSVYGISTKLGDLDFGMFLQATHEANILSIIEISFWKWCLVLFVTLIVAAVEDTFGKQLKCLSSDPKSCDATNFVLLFTLAGMVNFVFAIVLFYWGRTSELRLFASCGVNHIDDYTVFLLTEDRATEIIDSNSVSNQTVKQTIAELMAEEKHLKIQEHFESQKQQKRMASFRAVARKIRTASNIMRGSARIGTSGTTIVGSSESDNSLPLPNRERSAILPLDTMAEGSRSGSDVSELEDVPHSISSDSIMDSNSTVNMPKLVWTHLEEFECPPEPASSKRNSVQRFTSISEETDEFTDENYVCKNKKFEKFGSYSELSSEDDEPVVIESTMSAVATIDPRKEHRAKLFESIDEEQGESAQDSDSNTGNAVISPESENVKMTVTPPQTAHGLGVHNRGSIATRRRATTSSPTLIKQFSSGASFRESIDKIIKDGIRYSKRQTENDIQKVFKSRLKNNFNKQNFKKVFLFGAPELFYSMISFVITCNSLYLAWWSTHIAKLIIFTIKDPLLMMFVSLLPAVLTLPFLALAIRSSSVLRAITYLSLEVVGSVMDRSAANAASLEEFRNGFVKVCTTQNPKDPRHAMQRICYDFSADHICLTRHGFTDMLLSCGMLYQTEKIKFIFSCIDINGGSTVDMGVSRFILFTL
jgi:hypothetical protein